MTLQQDDLVAEENDQRQLINDPLADKDHISQTLTLAALQIWALAAYSVSAEIFDLSIQPVYFIGMLGIALLGPIVGFCLQAIAEGRLPSKQGGEPKHEHITGLGAIALLVIIIFIVALAAWAANDPEVGRRIHQQFGAWIVFVLSAVFVAAAMLPGVDIHAGLKRFGSAISKGIKPIGDALSVVDSILVFGVAPTVGATFSKRFSRYAFLAVYFIPLGLLGYWLPAPWGLVPIFWALIAAIAVSRRWAWVEDDRETAMLNAKFRGPHLRVVNRPGFAGGSLS